MNDDKKIQALHQNQKALLVIYGIVGTLFLLSLAGDIDRETPWGWFVLWFLTTVSSIPFGIVMLTGRWWKEIPLEKRRGTAMGYLIVGFVNLISLALDLRWYSMSYIFTVPLALLYGVALLLVNIRLRGMGITEKEELFP